MKLLAIVFAKDMGRMTAFYRDGLGLSVVPEESSEGYQPARRSRVCG